MVNYDISKVFGALPEIIKGLPMTLLVILLTTLLGSLLGGLVAWASLSKDKALENLAKGYVFIYFTLYPTDCVAIFSILRSSRIS